MPLLPIHAASPDHADGGPAQAHQAHGNLSLPKMRTPGLYGGIYGLGSRIQGLELRVDSRMPSNLQAKHPEPKATKSKESSSEARLDACSGLLGGQRLWRVHVALYRGISNLSTEICS